MSQGVGRLGFNRSEKTFFGTSKQPVDQAFIRRNCPPSEPVIASVETLDFELLPRFNVILLPKFGRQHNLTFRGNRRFHKCKISSYLCLGQAVGLSKRSQGY